MRFLILFLIINLVPILNFAQEKDEIWENRNSLEGAKKAYEYYKKEYETKKDYDSAWKFARAAHFYTDNFIKDNELKKKLFSEGKDAAAMATNLGPNKPEGWYYFGVCLGSWAEANGIMQSLSAAGPILNSASMSINADPNYEKGVAYNLRARVYHKAPQMISVGDPKKAERDYLKALELNPNYRVAYRFYSEFLLDKGRKEEARVYIDKGLSVPYSENDKIIEDKEIKILKELKEKAK